MTDWKETPDFPFAHGENARSSSLYHECVVEASVRPSEHGKKSRKLVAMFEARNPNGLISRVHQQFPEKEPEGLRSAISFLERYGGLNCLGEWPPKDKLYDALKQIELVIGEAIPSQNPDWTRDEIILALEFYLSHRGGSIPGKNSAAIERLADEIRSVAFALGLRGNEKFRNPNGVYMKIMNLRSRDPDYTSEGKVGLAATNKLEEEVWDRFLADLEGLQTVAASIRSQTDGVINTAQGSDTDEPEIEEASEGRIVSRLHRTRERSRKIVAEKKKQFLKENGRLFCEACGFDFASVYGSRGEGFIECHHTKPVHEMSAGEKTSLADLALLCANCHRMVHARRPWLSIGEVKACIAKKQQKVSE